MISLIDVPDYKHLLQIRSAEVAASQKSTCPLMRLKGTEVEIGDCGRSNEA